MVTICMAKTPPRENLLELNSRQPCHIMGDSRKYPYPTTGGMSILTPLALENSKLLIPPCPPNSKIANPPSSLEFSTFVSDPLEFLFVCLKLQTNEKLFPSVISRKNNYLELNDQNTCAIKQF